jgi:phosphatidylserine decarboxylase
MKIRHEVLPFLGIAVVAGVAALLLKAPLPVFAVTALAAAFVLYFFRDPERYPPQEWDAIVSGADGRVMSVTALTENEHLNTACVRISVFLSLFDVHVNRSPLSGQSTFIGYYPGKTVFAFREKSSEVNQHNKILIEGPYTRCLVAQIVGPFARRVVYWLDPKHAEAVKAGDRIGMMKFGSRLDVYLPEAEIKVLVKPGDRVRAGETVIARVRDVQRDGRVL